MSLHHFLEHLNQYVKCLSAIPVVTFFFFLIEIIFLKLYRHLNNGHSWGVKTIAQWRVQEERVRQMEIQVDEYEVAFK